MSIQTIIKSLAQAGDLVAYQPQFVRTRKGSGRRLYMTKAAWQEHANPYSAASLLGLRGSIEAAMTRWVNNELVYKEFLARLKPPPPEIWEIRVTWPQPQIRLFCRFAEPDTLILTRFRARNILGKKGSIAWSEAMVGCEADWNALNPPLTPFSATSIAEYVTENCNDFPI